MMLIGYLIISAIGWLIAAVIFEGGYSLLKAQHRLSASKEQVSRLFWGVLGLLSFVMNCPALVLNLPALLPIAWSHIQLCKQQEANITPHQIVRHMGKAAAEFAQRILFRIK